MSIVDDLLDRWEEMRERGEHVSAEELCREYPDLLPEVRRQISALEAVSLQFGSAESEVTSKTNSESTWNPSGQFELLNRFEIIKLHASGGLGHVYLAHDKVLDRPVAIKFLKRAELTKEQLERFEWEAKITGRLEHPGIVPIHSMQESESSSPCYVMRFVNGKTLAQSVQAALQDEREDAPHRYYHSVKFQQLLRAFVTVCNIVAYAHSQGVIHRDIKPGNIMLGPFGETLLLDWGIAKHFESPSHPKPQESIPNSLLTVHVDQEQLRALNSLDSPTYTATGQAIGTPAYASPEQMQGLAIASQPSTDLFSLGATLHFILSGKAPIEMYGWSDYLNCCSVAETQLASKLPSRAPKALMAICNKAMRTQPTDRYATALELAADVENYLAQESVSVFRDPWYSRLVRAARKRPGISGAIIAASVVLLVATAIASGLLDAKNRRLSEATKSLNNSLGKTQLANEQVLATLRKMFHVAVIDKFSRLEELTDVERDYLSQMLEQYSIFAESMGEDIRSKTVQAEANYRAAHLWHWLSHDQEAIPLARKSVEVYEELCKQHQQATLIIDYLESVRLLSEMLVRTNDPDIGIELANRGLVDLSYFQSTYPTIDPGPWLKKRSSLSSNIVSGFVQKQDWKRAFIAGQSALAEWRERLKNDPTDRGGQRSLASALSVLTQLAVHPETGCDSKLLIQYADEAVQILKQLLEAEPNESILQDSYANALYSRALAYYHNDRIAECNVDLDYAIAYQERLRIRHKLYSEYNHQVVRYRLLKIRILRNSSDWKGIIDQIEHLRDLQLTVEAMTVCIERLSEYWNLYPQYPLTLGWLSEMYTRRADLLNSDSPTQTLDDRNSAIATLTQLVQQDPNEIQYHARLVQSLNSAAKDQRKFGNSAESQRLWQQAADELTRIKAKDLEQFERLSQEITDVQAIQEKPN